MDCFVKVEQEYSQYDQHIDDHLILDFFQTNKTDSKSPTKLHVKSQQIDSTPILNSFYSPQNHSKPLISQIEQSLDLKRTNLRQILNLKKNLTNQQIEDDKQFLKEIKKRKLILKRQYAKKRTYFKKYSQTKLNDFHSQQQLIDNFISNPYCETLKTDYFGYKQTNHADSVTRIQYPSGINSAENQSQKKKKRNRVSAQISRDKKKQYVMELEQENCKLKQIQSEYQNLKQIHIALQRETIQKDKIISIKNEKLMMEQSQRLILIIKNSQLQKEIVKLKREFVYKHFNTFFQFQGSQ